MEVWLHELFPGDFEWVERNLRMRNDEHGMEIWYKREEVGDKICGARAVHPGTPEATDEPWLDDASLPHDVVCTIVGPHDEMPHIGVSAKCADHVCDCYKNGAYHLVIIGFSIVYPGRALINGRYIKNIKELNGH